MVMHCVCGTVTYRSRGDAWAEAQRIQRRVRHTHLEPYECNDQPGAWHLTGHHMRKRRHTW
jgi:hypothetical protein